MKKIFVTGSPGVGKTTLIKHLIQFCDINYLPFHGFYTDEIRERNGQRVGFEYKLSTGQKGILAHISSHSTKHVGKYGVEIENFERDIIPILENRTGVVIIDEIGKMESYSMKFIQLVRELLKSELPVVSTISLSCLSFYHEQKDSQSNFQLYHLTRENVTEITQEITQYLLNYGKIAL